MPSRIKLSTKQLHIAACYKEECLPQKTIKKCITKHAPFVAAVHMKKVVGIGNEHELRVYISVGLQQAHEHQQALPNFRYYFPIYLPSIDSPFVPNFRYYFPSICDPFAVLSCVFLSPVIYIVHSQLYTFAPHNTCPVQVSY